MTLLETPLENILVPSPVNRKWLTDQEMEQYQTASLLLKQAETAAEDSRMKARQRAAKFLLHRRLLQRQREARWTTQHKAKLAEQERKLEALAERRLTDLLQNTVQWLKNEAELEKELFQNTLSQAKLWLMQALKSLSREVDWTPKVSQLVEEAMAEFTQTKTWILSVAEEEHKRLSALLSHHEQLDLHVQSELAVGCAILQSPHVRIRIEASKGYQQLIALLGGSKAASKSSEDLPEGNLKAEVVQEEKGVDERSDQVEDSEEKSAEASEPSEAGAHAEDKEDQVFPDLQSSSPADLGEEV